MLYQSDDLVLAHAKQRRQQLQDEAQAHRQARCIRAARTAVSAPPATSPPAVPPWPIACSTPPAPSSSAGAPASSSAAPPGRSLPPPLSIHARPEPPDIQSFRRFCMLPLAKTLPAYRWADRRHPLLLSRCRCFDRGTFRRRDAALRPALAGPAQVCRDLRAQRRQAQPYGRRVGPFLSHDSQPPARDHPHARLRTGPG